MLGLAFTVKQKEMSREQAWQGLLYLGIMNGMKSILKSRKHLVPGPEAHKADCLVREYEK
jgi:hypothetical protein